MRNYIGLDAHSKTCTFVVVNEAGREVAAQKVPTGEKALVGFVRSLSGKKLLTFEESNLSQWLYTLFEPEVDQQVVCNPSYIVKRKGPKGDYLDGLHLAQQLRGNFLTPVVHERTFLFQLRSLVSAYEALVQDLARVKVRYKAFCRSRARFVAGKKVYRDAEQPKQFSEEMDQFIAQDYYSRIRALEEKKTGYQARFQGYAKKVSEIRVLDTIPGIGAVRGCTIAAVVGTPSRFRNKYKFWSYCELVRHDWISDGESYGRKTIRAHRGLKNVFLSAAQNAIDNNLEIQVYYEDLMNKGQSHPTARKNIARILAAISLAVMRTKKPYNPNLWKGKTKAKNNDVTIS